MNPKLSLAIALYDVLNGRVQDEQGHVVPVFANVPLEYTGGSYILLSQYTAAEANSTPLCRGEKSKRWRCTVLMDSIVPFKTQGEASIEPGMLLTEQTQELARSLAFQTLGGLYYVESVTVELTNHFGETSGDAYWLHDPTRLVFTISAAVQPLVRALRITPEQQYRITPTGALRTIL
jgi:hypothetical protein